MYLPNHYRWIITITKPHQWCYEFLEESRRILSQTHGKHTSIVCKWIQSLICQFRTTRVSVQKPHENFSQIPSRFPVSFQDTWRFINSDFRKICKFLSSSSHTSMLCLLVNRSVYCEKFNTVECIIQCGILCLIMKEFVVFG